MTPPGRDPVLALAAVLEAGQLPVRVGGLDAVHGRGDGGLLGLPDSLAGRFDLPAYRLVDGEGGVRGSGALSLVLGPFAAERRFRASHRSRATTWYMASASARYSVCTIDLHRPPPDAADRLL